MLSPTSKDKKGLKGCSICNSQVVIKEEAKLQKQEYRDTCKYYRQKDTEPLYTFYDLVKDLIPNLENPKERLIQGC